MGDSRKRRTVGRSQKRQPTAKKRGLLGGLTGNALISGIISAVVAGVISLIVANYQDQAAARQVASGQQATAVVQLEAAANTFYQGTVTLLNSCYKKPALCPNEAYLSPWNTYQATFNASRSNVSDPQAGRLAGQLDDDAATAIEYAGFDESTALSWFNKMAVTYQQLIARCGQLVRNS
jgi:type II secretory pathway pseudopilin PulG